MIRPLRRWVRRLLTTNPPPRPVPRPTVRPTLERLEDRVTPSVTFGGQTTVGLGPFPYSMATADFNGDGRPDLAVGVDNDSTVAVVLDTTAAGATVASFAASLEFPAGAQPNSVAAGDFNGDGRPDLAVANFGDNTVSVLLNTMAAGAAAPSFAAQRTFAVGSGPQSVAVGDVNGDGKPDLVVANDLDGTVSVLLNTTATGATAPSFAAQKTFAAANAAVAVALGDFNGDGRPDLVVTDGNVFPAEIDVLLNTTPTGATAPSFAARKTFGVGSDPLSVAVGDFNGDGKPDVAVANYSGNMANRVSVLLDATPDGATSPSFAVQATFATGAAPASVSVVDVNGDGRPDLVTANGGDNTASVLLDATPAGATAASFAPQATFALPAGASPALLADFNGDGRPDLAAVNFGSTGKLTVRLNTTAPFAATAPAVVADVPGLGAVEYNQVSGAWMRLNPSNPSDVSLLATDALGDVFADYPGYGVYRYVPSLGSWHLINGTDAVALAVDAAGDVFASFAGAGVGEFRRDGTSKLLTPAAATLLSSDAVGDLAVVFPGYGVYRYTASGGFTLLNGTTPQAVAIDGAGDVFASFAGAGTAEFRRDGTSKLLTPSAASSLSADAAGDLAAVFQGYGLYRYTASGGFTLLNGTTPPAAAIDANDEIFASFAGAGTVEFRLSGGGALVSSSSASLLAADPFGDPLS